MEVKIWGGPKFQLLKTVCRQLERLNAFLSFRHTTGESKLTKVSKKSDISAINPGKWSLKLNNTIQPSRTVSGNRETQGRRNETQRWVKLASLNKINTISSKCYICRKETLEPKGQMYGELSAPGRSMNEVWHGSMRVHLLNSAIF